MTQSDFVESAKQREIYIDRVTRIFSAAKQNRQSNDGFILRGLNPNEKKVLQTTNSCHDWSKILLMLPKENAQDCCSHMLQSLVSNTTFDGTVVIGVERATTTMSADSSALEKLLPVGIHSNALVSNCIFEANCKVHGNTILADTFVASHSVIAKCGNVYYCNNGKDDDRIVIDVGAESGGKRPIPVTPESNMIQVCRSLACPTATEEGSPTIIKRALNIVSENCIIRDTPTICNIYLSQNTSIRAATSVSNAILLPGATISNSATVTNVFMQWDSSIQDNSSISDSLLMEQAHAGPQSIVASSILGPDVHVSAGEVHASLVGPNTNAHHQSLVIGVLWPLGRGNVGYGANVGSNHTGRLPDQETTAGEGTFWGLSCVVKFPVDLTWAPYSIVAAGVAFGPTNRNRVAMPFSLILDSKTILPGWVLLHSPYTLERSEQKYANRRKAKRHDFYTGWKIIRPETVEMCYRARRELLQDESMIRGIGNAKLTEKGKKSGIQAYSQLIQRFALQGLLSWVQQQQAMGQTLDETMLRNELLCGGSFDVKTILSSKDIFQQASWPVFPWEVEASDTWRYQKYLLCKEFDLGGDNNIRSSVSEMLRKLVELEAEHAKRVHKSKKRDDQRGAQVIPGYASSHVAAEKDPVIVMVRERLKSTEKAVNDLLEKLDLHRSRL